MEYEQLQPIILVAGVFVHTLVTGAIALAAPFFNKIPYHTSILTGEGWVLKLINGHPKRIQSELGVRLHVFHRLVTALKVAGVTRSKHIALEEKLAIFSYASVTGLSIQHLGEQFQHSNETISKCVEQHQFSLYLSDSLVFVRYFGEILFALSSPPFYTKYIYLPSNTTPIPDEIQDNLKSNPFFKDALGEIDGTHINCCPSVAERQSAWNQKGGVSQNCLACCSFDLHFQYVLSV
jgi:hypothetical protein